jgi:ureidoacrylate peracid hydrolase
VLASTIERAWQVPDVSPVSKRARNHGSEGVAMVDLAGARSPIDLEGTVVLVCDMQNDFIHSDGAFARNGKDVSSGQALIPVIGRVLAAARGAGYPIVYTRVSNRADGVGQSVRTSRLIGALMEGTWGVEVVDELGPTPADIVIDKWRYSAFYATALETILRGLGARTLVLTGVSTSGGVDSTARDAEYRDFRVVMLSDGCTDRPDLHEAALERCRLSFGQVMTSGELLRLVRNPAGT